MNIDRTVLYFKLSVRGGNGLAEVQSGKYIHKGHRVDPCGQAISTLGKWILNSRTAGE